MTGERWSPSSSRPAKARRVYFQEWATHGLVQWGITFGGYAELREDGRWNEYAREHLGGRFTVEEGEG